MEINSFSNKYMAINTWIIYSLLYSKDASWKLEQTLDHCDLHSCLADVPARYAMAFWNVCTKLSYDLCILLIMCYDDIVKNQLSLYYILGLH